MKKRVSRIRVNTKKSHSDAMLKNMLQSLLRFGKVETTSARAKMLKRFADREIAYALSAKGTVVKNQLESRLGGAGGVSLMISYVNLLKEKKDRVKDGSYVKIMKTRFRSGDNAEMSEVILSEYEDLKKAMEAEEKKQRVAKKKSPRKKAKPTEKKKVDDKKELKEEKKPASKKSKVPETEAPKKQGGLLDRLGGRILGRQVRPDAGGQRGRSTARSGI